MAHAPRRPRAYALRIALAMTVAAGALAGCRDSVTAVRVVSSWSGNVDQLEFTITGPQGAVILPAERRPKEPATLTSPIDVLVYVDERLAGKELTCEVLGYLNGVALLSGTQTATVEAGGVRDAHVELAIIRKGCTKDADCTGGGKCESGACRRRAVGQACAMDSECGSGFCQDRVCCESRCDTKCFACNQPDAMGQCRPVEEGKPDPRGACKPEPVATCGLNGLCDATQNCAKHPQGTMCKPPTCTGTVLQTANVCDGAGTCQPGDPVPCAPFTCKNNACVESCVTEDDCAMDPDRPRACVLGSCGKKGNGQPCVTGEQCESTFCVDKVCCNEACQGQCRTCSSAGKCTITPASQPDPRGLCPIQSQSSCGTNGRCDGTGGCQRWGTTTVCRPGTCDAVMARQTAPATCNGLGMCPAPPSVTCGAYKCDGTTCLKSCNTNVDCIYPATCIGGACTLKGPGQACSTSSECTPPVSCNGGVCQLKGFGVACTMGTQCASGFCTEGVCCNMANCGTCRSCRVAGSVGQCQNLPEGPAPAHCSTESTTSCGRNGRCNGGGECSRYAAGTVCQPPTCNNADPTSPRAVYARTCNGEGMCLDRGSVPCGHYACNPNNGQCYTSCTTSAMCRDNDTCSRNNTCR